MKKYREAAVYYEKALRQGARDPQIHYNLAYTYDKLGEKRKAIAEYEKYAATRPTMDILSKLADHYMKTNNYSGAVKSYERMIKIQPRKASLYAGLGYAHGLKGNTDKEIDYYRKALRYDMENEDVHLKLGAAYEKKQMWNEALAEYSKAYQLNPDSSRAARKIPQLKIKIIRQKHKET
jgi:tetratricopeptide (TPR) repeat protein